MALPASPSGACQRPCEFVFLPGAAAHDHALDPGPCESADLVRRERCSTDVDERLRTPLRGVAEPLGPAAGEEDRLH